MQAACFSKQAEQQQPTSSTSTAAGAAQGWQQAAKPEGTDQAEQECKEEVGPRGLDMAVRSSSCAYSLQLLS
jgi:hypothetical protein